MAERAGSRSATPSQPQGYRAQTSPFDFLRARSGGPRFLYGSHGRFWAAAGIAAEEDLAAPARTPDRRFVAIPFRPEGRDSRPRAVRPAEAFEAECEPTPPPGLARVPRDAWVADPGFDEWARRVRTAQQAIRSGRLQKLVLARRVTARKPDGLDPVDLCEALAAGSPAARTFYLELTPGDVLVGASPELLAARNDERFTTVALAGSRPRGRDATEDDSLARSLMASSKEAWEHELVCRFLRQRLTERKLPWRVTGERQLLRLPNVQHLETRFEAEPSPNEHLLEFATRLHPTPAVAGSPVPEALAELSNLEPEPRGYYAGAVGWFDEAGHGELAVALRCARIRGDQITLYAGCGIVNESDPADEWQESNAKLDLVRGLLSGPERAP